jgi:hypothetical protein
LGKPLRQPDNLSGRTSGMQASGHTVAGFADIRSHRAEAGPGWGEAGLPTSPSAPKLAACPTKSSGISRVGAPAAARAELIALTGHGPQEAHRRCQDAGIDLHLRKPVEADSLLEILARCSQVVTG